jgi:hypothetical protein
MGLPFDTDAIDEKEAGILDVEALLMMTFMSMGRNRMATDVPAWITRFSDVINHQKLKGLWASFPDKHRKRVTDNLSLFPRMHKNFRDIFALKGSNNPSAFKSVQDRMSKLNFVEHVAQSSIMIKNRLLYGTGFRADLITLLQIENLKLNARQMSKMLSAADSTISRLLSDLRAAQLLDENNEMRNKQDRFPGLFLSSYSIWNLLDLIDAQEFQSDELRRAAIERLDMRFDGFTRLLLRQ